MRIMLFFLIFCLAFSSCAEVATKNEPNVSFYESKNETSTENTDNSVSGTENTNVRESLIPVPALCQYPELPTGCESTAAAMVLNFYGAEISPSEFASAWLECSEDFYTYNGVFYGPDPNMVFAGDPFSSAAYGCFSNPIANAINRNSQKLSAEVIIGKRLDELCESYIANGKPLLIWATMAMKKSYSGKSWTTPEGSTFTWIAGEHCLVLVGFDERFYYLNDPMSGSLVAYPKETVQKRFDELGSQAVLICNSEYY